MIHYGFRRFICRLLFLVYLLSIIYLSVEAQPSGGPYGPVQQKYELPKVIGNIYYVAPYGKEEQSGKNPDQPTTIEAAVAKVKTGDAIVMRGGVYRTGNLELNQGITIQPYYDELPVLKGTYVAKDWKEQDNGLWTISWSRLFPSEPQSWWRRYREGKKTPPYRFNNDMVFVNGKFLQAVGWEGEVDENSYYIDYDSGTVYIGIDPADKLLEITAFNIGLHRVTTDCHGKRSDGKGPVIKGIKFTQYAYRAIEIEGTNPEGLSDEKNHGKDVTGTILEHCEISYCSRVAAYLRGDSLIMRHCKVSNTSTEGIYILSSSDVLLEKNIFTKNNIENITGYYPAAVKIFNQTYRVTCRDNLVIDLPNSNGIWYDVGNVDGVFINNWVEGVGSIDDEMRDNQLWPSDNGFFFEISKGVICAGNVFVNCDHGLMILNSSDAEIYQNTFINSIACIGRTARGTEPDHFGWHPSTGPDVDERDGHVFMNNLLSADENFNKSLLFVWQPDSLCGMLNEQQLKVIDNNVYVRQSEENKYPLILWSPYNNNCQIRYESPKRLKDLNSKFSLNSEYYKNYRGPLFKSYELKNFELLQGFPGADKGTKIPEKVSKLLDISSKNIKYIGAYPMK